jgi:hypothetical protein
MALVTFNSHDIQHDLRVINQAYKDLPAGLVKRQVKAAMKKAMQPWLPEFRSIAPVGKKLSRKTIRAKKQEAIPTGIKADHYKPGNLKRSVQAMSGNDNRYGFWAKVGYGRSKRKKGNHAVLLNDGTKPRVTKAGKSTGRGPATQFAEPLANRIRQQGAYQFSLQIEAAIERGYAQLDKYLAARLKSRRRKG